MSAIIRQEIVFAASPEKIYSALMTSETHAAFTGAPAEVSSDEGGACSWHGGYVSGRNIELVENKRIVQAWRAQGWDEGVYSIVRYELVANGGETKLVLEQTGHPAGTGEHLDTGWHEKYWKPLRAYLEAK